MVSSNIEPSAIDEAGADPSGKSSAPAREPAAKETLRYFGPTTRWRLFNILELWRHRELLWALAVRDIKVRYRQTLVGVAWVVLQPLAMAGVFLVFFGLLGRLPAPEGIPYSLILLTGLLPWQMVSGTVSQATVSLVTNQQLIRKVYFPRLVLPLATAIPPLVDFTIAAALPVGVMVYYQLVPSWHVVFVPVFVGLAVLAAVAVGIWLSAVNAIYRDFGYVVPVILQLGFFLSPVVYTTSSLVPEGWQPVAALNPMVGAIEGLRWAMLGIGDPPVLSAAIGAAVTGFVLLTGLTYFRRIEGFLADRI
ncbi:MAG: type transporter [Gemmataceae bacterium]|nr:type transporter [Gemmataceae bacterium]